MLTHARRHVIAALVALAATAQPGVAQRVDPTPAPAEHRATVTRAATGPTLDAGRVAARPLASTEAPTAPRMAAQGMGQAAALMIVGFGALLVGAIIGGDAGTIFMVGGAIVGLAGLYQYLK
jgi:hypothetical protein